MPSCAPLHHPKTRMVVARIDVMMIMKLVLLSALYVLCITPLMAHYVAAASTPTPTLSFSQHASYTSTDCFDLLQSTLPTYSALRDANYTNCPHSTDALRDFYISPTKLLESRIVAQMTLMTPNGVQFGLFIPMYACELDHNNLYQFVTLYTTNTNIPAQIQFMYSFRLIPGAQVYITPMSINPRTIRSITLAFSTLKGMEASFRSMFNPVEPQSAPDGAANVTVSYNIDTSTSTVDFPACYRSASMTYDQEAKYGCSCALPYHFDSTKLDCITTCTSMAPVSLPQYGLSTKLVDNTALCKNNGYCSGTPQTCSCLTGYFGDFCQFNTACETGVVPSDPNTWYRSKCGNGGFVYANTLHQTNLANADAAGETYSSFVITTPNLSTSMCTGVCMCPGDLDYDSYALPATAAFPRNYWSWNPETNTCTKCNLSQRCYGPGTDAKRTDATCLSCKCKEGYDGDYCENHVLYSTIPLRLRVDTSDGTRYAYITGATPAHHGITADTLLLAKPELLSTLGFSTLAQPFVDITTELYMRNPINGRNDLLLTIRIDMLRSPNNFNLHTFYQKWDNAIHKGFYTSLLPIGLFSQALTACTPASLRNSVLLSIRERIDESNRVHMDFSDYNGHDYDMGGQEDAPIFTNSIFSTLGNLISQYDDLTNDDIIIPYNTTTLRISSKSTETLQQLTQMTQLAVDAAGYIIFQPNTGIYDPICTENCPVGRSPWFVGIYYSNRYILIIAIILAVCALLTFSFMLVYCCNINEMCCFSVERDSQGNIIENHDDEIELAKILNFDANGHQRRTSITSKLGDDKIRGVRSPFRNFADEMPIRRPQYGDEMPIRRTFADEMPIRRPRADEMPIRPVSNPTSPDTGRRSTVTQKDADNKSVGRSGIHTPRQHTSNTPFNSNGILAGSARSQLPVTRRRTRDRRRHDEFPSENMERSHSGSQSKEYSHDLSNVTENRSARGSTHKSSRGGSKGTDILDPLKHLQFINMGLGSPTGHEPPVLNKGVTSGSNSRRGSVTTPQPPPQYRHRGHSNASRPNVVDYGNGPIQLMSPGGREKKHRITSPDGISLGSESSGFDRQRSGSAFAQPANPFHGNQYSGSHHIRKNHHDEQEFSNELDILSPDLNQTQPMGNRRLKKGEKQSLQALQHDKQQRQHKRHYSIDQELSLDPDDAIAHPPSTGGRAIRGDFTSPPSEHRQVHQSSLPVGQNDENAPRFGDWKRVTLKGSTYYINEVTMESRWELPADGDDIDDTFGEKRFARSQSGLTDDKQ